MANQIFKLDRIDGKLVPSYIATCSLSELKQKINAKINNLEVYYNQYIASKDYNISLIIEEWYKAYLIEQELEVLPSIPADRASDYNTAKATIDRLENGYITTVGTKVNQTTGETEPDVTRTYLAEGDYYPWLKYFRGDKKYTEPVYESSKYENLYELNSIANAKANASLFIESEAEAETVIKPYFLGQLSSIREDMRFRGFLFKGINFCADRIVQNDISSIVLQYTINMIPEDFQYMWKIRTGEYYTFNGKAEVVEFSAQLVGFINACFRQEEATAEKIRTMTLDELKSLDLAHLFSNIYNN